MTTARTWMLIGPVAFLVHDTEEIVTLGPWLREHGDELPTMARAFVDDFSTSQFATSVVVLGTVYAIVTALGVRSLRRGRTPWPYLVATGALVGNGLTHLLQALYFHGYTPGVVTALLVTLPYGWLAARALARDGIATRRLMYTMLVAGILLQLPLVISALAMGEALHPSDL